MKQKIKVEVYKNEENEENDNDDPSSFIPIEIWKKGNNDIGQSHPDSYDVLSEIRDKIQQKDIQSFQVIIKRIIQDYNSYQIEYIYQKTLFCCIIHKFDEGIVSLVHIYNMMPMMKKMKLSGTFSYGKHLILKSSKSFGNNYSFFEDKDIYDYADWYTTNVINKVT